MRNEDGVREIGDFITTGKGYTTYPVIRAINDHELIVAYSSKKEYGKYVKWKREQLDR